MTSNSKPSPVYCFGEVQSWGVENELLSEATVKKQVNNALKVLRAKLETLLSLILFL